MGCGVGTPVTKNLYRQVWRSLAISTIEKSSARQSTSSQNQKHASTSRPVEHLLSDMTLSLSRFRAANRQRSFDVQDVVRNGKFFSEGSDFMDALILSRLQFAITTIYHFLFVPVTLGLSIFVALLETWYVNSNSYEERVKLKKLVKFFGTIFLINFAMGVVTGIVQEFHFGMNWSEYARFMGDIFGAPLALEALTAFFIESTFIGLWIFGWDKLSEKSSLPVHLDCRFRQ